MYIIHAERLRVTDTNRSIIIEYEHTHVTCCVTSMAATEPPDPIEMGPIIHDAEEVTS